MDDYRDWEEVDRRYPLPYHAEGPKYYHGDEPQGYHNQGLPPHGNHDHSYEYSEGPYDQYYPPANHVPRHYRHDHLPQALVEQNFFYSSEEDDRSPYPPYHTLETALQEADVQLPRLAVLAPLSVLPQKGGGRTGLPNLGNTCYISSVLQCLYHTPTFPARLALACEALGDGRKGEDEVAGALHSLMTCMDDGRVKRGVLAYFKGICGLRDETFANAKQQEAQDFLTALLHWLHEDLVTGELDCACPKHKRKAKYQTSSDSTTSHNQQPLPPSPPHDDSYYYHNHSHQQPLPLPETTHQAATNQPTRMTDHLLGRKCRKCSVPFVRHSIILEMFEGIHQSSIICRKQGVILHTVFERFTCLSLSVHAREEVSLEEALQEYYKVQVLRWDCEYCKSNHACHQQAQILQLPQVLLIHLSRYTTGSSQRKQRVIFPTDQLTLDEYMTPGKQKLGRRYALHAICNHSGTMAQGHYTACCRSNDSHQHHRQAWHFFDDEAVKRVDRFKNAREAHILFYKIQT